MVTHFAMNLTRSWLASVPSLPTIQSSRVVYAAAETLGRRVTELMQETARFLRLDPISLHQSRHMANDRGNWPRLFIRMLLNSQAFMAARHWSFGPVLCGDSRPKPATLGLIANCRIFSPASINVVWTLVTVKKTSPHWSKCCVPGREKTPARRTEGVPPKIFPMTESG